MGNAMRTQKAVSAGFQLLENAHHAIQDTLKKTFCLSCEVNCASRTSKSSCKQYSYLKDGNCTSYPTGCKSYNVASSECLGCLSGYYLNNKNCLSCGKNCENCTTNVTCTGCNSGYYLVRGVCFVLPTGCITLDAVTLACIECSQNYFLYIDECIQCQSSCITCNGNQGCVQCASGFNTVHGYCLASSRFLSSNYYLILLSAVFIYIGFQ